MEQLSIVKVLEAQFGLDLMHQPIPPVPSPPSPWGDPQALALFLPWMANSQGWGLLSCQIPPGWGRKKRANAPSSVNTATFFIDRTVKRAILSILM